MSDAFNPYHKWLGIPVEEQPANLYRLLGVGLFESDPDVIESAADQRMAHLRTFQAGRHSALSQKLLNEVAAAKVCLLKPGKKAAYDSALRQSMAAQTAEERSTSGVQLDAALAGLIEQVQQAPLRPRPIERRSSWQLWAKLAAGACIVGGFAVLLFVQRGEPQKHQPDTEPQVAAQTPPEPTPTTIPKPVAAPEAKPQATAEPQTKKLVEMPTTREEPKKSDEPRTTSPPSNPPPPAASADVIPKRPAVAKDAPKRLEVVQPAQERPAAAPVVKQPMPDEAALAKAMKDVEALYPTGKAKKADEKLKLAATLLAEAEKPQQPADRFAMLKIAAQMASEGGDAGLMLKAVDAAAVHFEFDVWTAKEAQLVRFLDATGDSGRLRTAVDAGAAFLDAALAEARIESATKVAMAMSRQAAKSYSREHRKRIADLRGDVERQARALQQIQAAIEKLKTTPDDPEANLAVGRWHCFDKNDWDQGLPLLAKGSDATLKSLSQQELALSSSSNPPSPIPNPLPLADAWWDAAQSAKSSDRAAMLVHAGSWYAVALESMPSGLLKTRAEKRLDDAIAAQKTLRRRAESTKREFVNSIGMKLVLIPAGEFLLGSTKEEVEKYLSEVPADSPNRDFFATRFREETPAVKARFSRSFYLGAFEATQGDYQRVMGRNPSSPPTEREGQVLPDELKRRPVTMVSWDDAVEFCRRLSALPGEKLHRRLYRLPTSAEWEYACRAGTHSRCYFGDDVTQLGDYAWYVGNSGAHPHSVGQKKPNAFGLCDMLGNVAEWSADWLPPLFGRHEPIVDPVGKAEPNKLAIRGGAWDRVPCAIRDGFRLVASSDLRTPAVGFRVACVIEGQ